MKLTDVQGRIADLIAADPWFAGVSVITEVVGDLEQGIQRALQRLGFGLTVATATATPKAADSQRLRMEVECVVSVIANPTLQGAAAASQTAIEGVDRVARLLHGAPLDPASDAPGRRTLFRIGALRAEPTSGMAIHQLSVLCEVPMPAEDYPATP